MVYICDEICGVSVYSTLEAEIIINDSDLDDALKLIFSIWLYLYDNMKHTTTN